MTHDRHRIVAGDDVCVIGDGPAVDPGEPVTDGVATGDGPTRKGDDGDGPAPHQSDGREDISTDAAGRVIANIEEGRDIVAGLQTTQALGLDAETTGLDPRSHRVRLVQLATPDGQVYVFDVFRIDAATLATTAAIPHVGTVLLDMAVNPASGRVYVTNTDARNAVRFEPNIHGHVAESRITVIDGTIPPGLPLSHRMPLSENHKSRICSSLSLR